MDTDKRIRVLQINSHISTSTSTGKQVTGLHNFFINAGLDSFVAFSEEKDPHKDHFLKYGCKIDKYISALLTRFFSKRYGRGNISTKKLISIINRVNPDVVHIHCINSYDVNIYKLICYLKNNNYPFVITEHAEFFFTGSCSHALDCENYKNGCSKCPRVFFSTKSIWRSSPKRQWLKMKKVFNGDVSCSIVTVSPWLLSRSIQSPILNHLKHRCIFNGVSLEEKPIKKETNNRKAGYFMFVTSDPKSNNKGINYLFETAKKMPNELFYVVGAVNKKIIKANKQQNVILLGMIKDQDKMNEIYSGAKAILLFSKVETFSMVVSESLAHGKPVFGFFAGGPESIAISDYCRFVEYGKLDNLIDEIDKFNFEGIDEETIKEEAKNRYSFNKIGKQYISLYQELIGLLK